MLLDGFDEITPSPWGRIGNTELRLHRQSAVRVVSAILDDMKGKSGVIVSGRDHFFDDNDEMFGAFGLAKNSSSTVLHIEEFNDVEAEAYLVHCGIPETLPEWFPKRPLLLTSLVHNNVLSAIPMDTKSVPIAWDTLIDIVCSRERKIHEQLNAEVIRRILESLASLSRETPSGLGPVTEAQIARAFEQETGSFPDETARALLQRLPGLSARNQQSGNRTFMDDNYVDMLRAGALTRFYDNPYSEPNARGWKHGIGEYGAQMAAYQLERNKSFSPPKSVNVAREAYQRWDAPTLAMDILLAAQQSLSSDQELDCEGLRIPNANIKYLDTMENAKFSGLVLEEACIDYMCPAREDRGLELQSCLIDELGGYGRAQAHPENMRNCDVRAYELPQSNDRILEDRDVPPTIRVCMTILRKIFVQPGSGRQENALYRGMSTELNRWVPPVLEVLSRYHIVYESKLRGNTIWRAGSGVRSRVHRILETGRFSNDEVVKEIGKLH
jgi:hypothetical protein